MYEKMLQPKQVANGEFLWGTSWKKSSFSVYHCTMSITFFWKQQKRQYTVFRAFFMRFKFYRTSDLPISNLQIN